MSTHSYSLRNRLGNTTVLSKTPTNSPYTKQSSRSPRKPSTNTSVLHLKHVIGTTTTTSSGLTSCEGNNSFAYCAGSVAVLAEVGTAGSIKYRYFKARPTAVAINPTSSHYDHTSNSNTPTRRSTILTPRKGYEDIQSRSFGREWLDESNNSTWSARERIKATTCVALSPDGKLLAVGETGYNPRVLLFSTAVASSTDTPLSIVTEHSIGVRSVAFSPDSKYLATLGDINDGFLYIWSVNTKTAELRLLSTNKCTTNVCDMTWCGNSVVTVGTRHIKIWQVTSTPKTSPQKRARLRMEGEQIPSPGPTPLQGRNCLLGKMVDATFTSVTAVSSDSAVVCADDGQLCVLDLSNGNVILSQTEYGNEKTAAISYHSNTKKIVWTDGSELQQRDIYSLTHDTKQEIEEGKTNANRLRPRSSKHSLLRESLGLTQSKRASVVALACLTDFTISIDSLGSIRWLPVVANSGRLDIDKLSTHRNLIRGLQKLPENAGLGSFFTWANDGEIRFWSSDGTLLRVEQCELDQMYDENDNETNELKTMRYAPGCKLIITGDRYGVVRSINSDSWDTCQTIRAHSADVTGIAIHDDTSMLATCSRDRMVQLFQIREARLVLLQTSDDHTSAVHHVVFSDDGHRLISCSADRTIVIRERMDRDCSGEFLAAFLSTRVITLKGSPLSLSLHPDDQKILFVSTMDRFVVKLDTSTGATLDTFKVADKDTDETATLNSICISVSDNFDGPPILAGYSSIDKSIRVYDMHKGILLGRDAGHTEGVSDMILVDGDGRQDSSSNRLIISTGLDSTIMIWSVTAGSNLLSNSVHDLSQSQVVSSWDSDNTSAKQSPASLPPLRKVLSKVEVAEFVRQSSPTRETSPHSIRRKTSRLALSVPIAESNESLSPEVTQSDIEQRLPINQKRSPSPQARSSTKTTRQSSTGEVKPEVDLKRPDYSRQSPSPPTSLVTLPTTPKFVRANNGRLRRPPSIPSDLRLQASVPQRRASVAVSSEAGSMTAASEATCRMLRTYRRKLETNRSDIDLNDLERELEAVLCTIRQRKGSTTGINSGTENQGVSTGNHNGVDGLALLLEKTRMDI